MENFDIEHLLKKFYRGETSLSEEAILESYYQKGKTDKESSGQDIFFTHLEVLKDQNAIDRIEDFVLKIAKPDSSSFTKKAINISIPWLSIAASVLFFFVGYYFSKTKAEDRTSISQIEVLKNENQYLKKDLILTQLDMPLANKRIQGIQSTSSVENNDPDIIKGLENVLLKDENTNVRLAAAYAIYRHKDIEIARNALIKSLESEKEPIIQLALINMMIAMDEREIMISLKESLKTSDASPMVIEKIEKGLLKLNSI